MSTCTELRELFPAVLEHEATGDDIERVRGHIDGCPECAALFDAMGMVVGAGAFLADVEPPAQLADELASSPCRRWLGLLYQAVDRECSPANLERLLSHLDSCPSCRQVWHDLSLIHQVGEAMAPPSHLLRKCIMVRNAVARITILPRRTATAAAYILALLASVAIGNPTIIAQDLHSAATEQVAKAASGVSEVAAEGRGEARVALWRAMQWGEGKIDAVIDWIDRLRNDDDKADEAAVDSAPDTKSQGESS